PLQRIVDFIDARRKEIRKDTAAYEVLDQWRRQLREGMLYRNWKARRLEARGDYLAALRLYNENILDQFSGHTPYDRAAIIHARPRVAGAAAPPPARRHALPDPESPPPRSPR